MNTAPAMPRRLDADAAGDREKFGKILALSGLAVADLGGRLDDDHPMFADRDRKGRLVYRCDPAVCGLHVVPAADADVSVMHAYAAQAHLPPHVLGDPYQLRSQLVENVSHVWLACGASGDLVTALGWRSFPTVAPS